MPEFAYYAHSHGSGHCRYADYVSSLVSGGVTVMTTRKHQFVHARRVVRLDSEDVMPPEHARYLLATPRYLHYSPVGLASIQRRSRAILDTILRGGSELVVVDVSVEVAALLRAASVPYIYVRMPGRRDDLAHVEAYRGAMGLVAYYPEVMEDPGLPAWIREKTAYLGYRPLASTPACPEAATLLSERTGGRRIITIVKGFGGAEELDLCLPRIRARYPEAFLVGLGNFSGPAAATLDHAPGVVDRLDDYLSTSNAIVTACGSNGVAELVSRNITFVAVPCARPYDEQEAVARGLLRNGLAISLSEFLAGQWPGAGPRVQGKSTTQSSYATYFRRLARAADWRDVLPRPTV